MTHRLESWSVTDGGGSYQRPFMVMGGDKLIASIFGNQLEPKAQSIAEAKRNAHLIAAAPALLEALEDVRRDPVWHAMSGTRREIVEAAIALAEGET